jgi:hypothetical protein
VPLTVHAFSFAQAARHFRGRLRLPAPPTATIGVQPTDLQLACSFVTEVTATYKAVRHFLRANPSVRTQGCPYPEYTPEFERMVELAARLRGQLEAKP